MSVILGLIMCKKVSTGPRDGGEGCDVKTPGLRGSVEAAGRHTKGLAGASSNEELQGYLP